jgi:hypothetical protein
MEGVEEIILLRARHELAKRFFPIRRESEALNEADFVFGVAREGLECKKQAEDQCERTKRTDQALRGEDGVFHGWDMVWGNDAAGITDEASFYCKDSVILVAISA